MNAEDDKETVRDCGELELVRRLSAGLPLGENVVKGAGDDCAVIERDQAWYTLLKTDAVVEGVHFESGTDPVRVGRKAMARVLSDIAAMGGIAEHALVTLFLNEDRPVSEVEGWYKGMKELAEIFLFGIVGGETTGIPGSGAALSVAMTGRVEHDRCLFRGTAQSGDLIGVTGVLGGSFRSGHHLDFVPRIREARWLSEGDWRPTSCMDLSDGLARDLPRLLEGTGLGYRIDEERIPKREGSSNDEAVGDGEDYELLMTIPPRALPEISDRWSDRFPGTPLHMIGEVVEGVSDQLPGGWEHFSTK